ncbi:MAG: M14 family metallocarboxypeptidase [Clostridia bacterium]|nr:M14 family metallocarboxypeptidase [Clostridia bacterium]
MSVDYLSPVTPEILQAFTDELIAKHQDIEISTLGASILGRNIPLYQLGHGKSASLFVGAHHGAEAITSLLLMKFTEDILDAKRRGLSRLAGFSVGGLLERRSIYIVPMLNPDGVAIAHLGAQAAGVLKDRVKSINGSEDFSLWQANARGVDLNHNYDAEFAKCKEAEHALGIFASAPTRYGGEYPESEPETAALADLTRMLSKQLRLAVALHTQGEEIYRDFEGKAPKGANMLAECFSRVSGYRVARPPKEASYGGYKDFVIQKLGIPAFTIECGNGKNPLPPCAFYGIYQKVLPILLTAASF